MSQRKDKGAQQAEANVVCPVSAHALRDGTVIGDLFLSRAGMPAITPQLLNTVRDTIEASLAIYVGGPWRCRVEPLARGYYNMVRVDIFLQTGQVPIFNYDISYESIQGSDARRFAGILQQASQRIERQVQEWLRANPPPPPRTEVIRFDIEHTLRGQGIDLDVVTQALEAYANKIDSTVIPEEIVPIEPPRRSKWERLQDDFLA